LVERLDAAGCSFVSVTQAFNTASSMGRLTLNVLLSFAQFEREVTAERIRDKIAASKKLGMWMGGVPPLGYDPHPDPTVRELVVNAAEADTVRTLFALYDRHANISTVAKEATLLGLRSKRHLFRSGRAQGGNLFSNGQIHKLLTNPVYLGRIRHKDKVWPGRHKAILDEDLWNQVQEKLQNASRRRRSQKTGTDPAPLIGKLRDETGDWLTPTHTSKAGRRHRYYVSHRLIAKGTDPTGWRLPAQQLETIVAEAIADHLDTATSRHQILATPDLRGNPDVAGEARTLVRSLRKGNTALLSDLLTSGILGSQSLTLVLHRDALANHLGVPPDNLRSDFHHLTAEVRLRRRGVEAKLIIGDRALPPDAVLLRTLDAAHQWTKSLSAGVPLADIAREAGHHDVHIRTRAQLAFLSPKIQRAICDGLQPADLTLKRILTRPVPLDWKQQERFYGFD
jgi:hypothetical protein